jgi:hypothetical protein
MMDYQKLLKDLGVENPISSTASATEQYIILQNNSLLNDVSNLKKELMEKTTVCDEFEEEIDSITRSRNSLQSYLKNQNEYMELMNTLQENTDKGYSKIINILCFMTLYCGMFATYVIHQPITDILVKMSLLTILLSSVIIGLYYLYEIEKKYILNTEIRNELDKQVKNNELVASLIDNM